MRIIARIDIKNNFVIKGINLEGLRKVGNPLELITKYYHDGIDEIIKRSLPFFKFSTLISPLILNEPLPVL